MIIGLKSSLKAFIFSLFMINQVISPVVGGQFVIDGGATLPETMSMGTN